MNPDQMQWTQRRPRQGFERRQLILFDRDI